MTEATVTRDYLMEKIEAAIEDARLAEAYPDIATRLRAVAATTEVVARGSFKRGEFLCPAAQAGFDGHDHKTPRAVGDFAISFDVATFRAETEHGMRSVDLLGCEVTWATELVATFERVTQDTIEATGWPRALVISRGLSPSEMGTLQAVARGAPLRETQVGWTAQLALRKLIEEDGEGWIVTTEGAAVAETWREDPDR